MEQLFRPIKKGFWRKRGTQQQAIGRSRGGLTTKIVGIVDALGNLLRLLLLPLQDLDERGATAVIPPKSNRKVPRDYDTHMYKWRHLVENYFAKIKDFRAIATRYDKTDTSYAANWYLCATIIAARWLSTGPRCAKHGAKQAEFRI